MKISENTKSRKKNLQKSKQKNNSSIPIRWITPQEFIEMDNEMEEWKADCKAHGAKFYGED